MHNPLSRAGFLVRRDHTLGVLLERLAGVQGNRTLVTEAGGQALSVADGAGLVATWADALALRCGNGDVVVVAAP
ncbi:MAG: hypothetical protein WKF43_11525, partial [Acidimicrobiales bacterium]